MWAKDRHHRIVSLLASNEHLSLERLAEETKVSRETLRRDIMQLESAGKLQRVHGGIVRPSSSEEQPFASRVQARSEAKRRIGVAASRLIEPGMLCAVDAGSTTSAFAAALATVPGVSMVTNSIDVALAIRAGHHDGEVILLGGRISSDVPATYGELTIAEMSRFTPKIAMFSPVAFSAQQGPTDFHLAEAEFARAMIERAERVVVLADHSKLGHTSRIQICGCDRIDLLVTDRKANPSALAELRAYGLRDVLLA